MRMELIEDSDDDEGSGGKSELEIVGDLGSEGDTIRDVEVKNSADEDYDVKADGDSCHARKGVNTHRGCQRLRFTAPRRKPLSDTSANASSPKQKEEAKSTSTPFPSSDLNKLTLVSPGLLADLTTSNAILRSHNATLLREKRDLLDVNEAWRARVDEAWRARVDEQQQEIEALMRLVELMQECGIEWAKREEMLWAQVMGLKATLAGVGPGMQGVMISRGAMGSNDDGH
jgi:hypothetical protein